MSFDSAVVDLDRAALRYDSAGLLPVVAQDAFTGRVLMLAWANAEAVSPPATENARGKLLAPKTATGPSAIWR